MQEVHGQCIEAGEHIRYGGDNRSACNYSIYFTDGEGRQISDVARIIADRTTISQERSKICVPIVVPGNIEMVVLLGG